MREHLDSPILNPLETAELSNEQNYNMIDGVMNNMEKDDILAELANAQKEVKNEQKQDKGKDKPEQKPSVLAKLRAGKEQVKQHDKQKEKNIDVER